MRKLPRYGETWYKEKITKFSIRQITGWRDICSLNVTRHALNRASFAKKYMLLGGDKRELPFFFILVGGT